MEYKYYEVICNNHNDINDDESDNVSYVLKADHHPTNEEANKFLDYAPDSDGGVKEVVEISKEEVEQFFGNLNETPVLTR